MIVIQNPPQKEIDQLKIFFDKGKFSLVFEKAKSIIKKYPNSFIIWNILGLSAYEIRKFNYAISSFEKAISLVSIFTK